MQIQQGSTLGRYDITQTLASTLIFLEIGWAAPEIREKLVVSTAHQPPNDVPKSRSSSFISALLCAPLVLKTSGG